MIVTRKTFDLIEFVDNLPVADAPMVAMVSATSAAI